MEMWRPFFTPDQRTHLAGRDPRIAVLYPSSGTRDADFWRLAPPGSSVYVVRLHAGGRHVDLGEFPDDPLFPGLAEGTELAAHVEPHAVVWMDTTGSFIYGPDGDIRQNQFMAQVTGATFSTTTSTAIVAACEHLSVSRVDIASPYPRRHNEYLDGFLGSRGIEVGRVEALELQDTYAISSVADDVQRRLVQAAAGSGEAVVVPCTDFFSLDLVAGLEAELGRPVLGANMVTMWHVCRGLGVPAPAGSAGLGRIFAA